MSFAPGTRHPAPQAIEFSSPVESSEFNPQTLHTLQPTQQACVVFPLEFRLWSLLCRTACNVTHAEVSWYTNAPSRPLRLDDVAGRGGAAQEAGGDGS
jgi:hypothetical protein